MDKKIFKELAKQAWYYVLSYFTHYLLPILKDCLKQTKDYFINLIWDSVKDEYTETAKSAVIFIEHFFNSESYKEKEKAAIDTLFKNVNLPLFLKPFKPILKNILKNKVRKLIEKYLKKLDIHF
jgi:hypothetical protein